MAPRSKTVTALLDAWSKGDEVARDELIPLVYDELRRVAARHLSREPRDHTLQATDLVHETYLRLVKDVKEKRVRWQNRAHFFGVAAALMRRILVDHDSIHGGVHRRVSLDVGLAASGSQGVEMIALDDAIEQLSALDPQLSRIVELRFFGGLSIKETAEVEDISPATVRRKWEVARAWLHSRIRGTEEDSDALQNRDAKAAPLLPGEQADLTEEAASVFLEPLEWLQTPNAHLAGAVPADLAARGEEWRVRELIRAIKYGMIW